MDQHGAGQPVALLEREQELDRVRALLRAAGRRDGQVLAIEGPAGIGKSRLLDEARGRALGLGLRLLDARATQLEQGFPFGVVRQLFERALAEADADERDLGSPERPRSRPTCSPGLPRSTATRSRA